MVPECLYDDLIISFTLELDPILEPSLIVVVSNFRIWEAVHFSENFNCSYKFSVRGFDGCLYSGTSCHS